MTDYADLLIRVLPRCQDGSCPVEVTYSGERTFPRGALDPAVLAWMPTGDSDADGVFLFDALLGEDGELRRAWAEARGGSATRRVRLALDPTEPALHGLPWELMRDGAAPAPLAADSQTPFSRHLLVNESFGRPVFERPLRLLAAVANPPGLEGFGCAPLDVAKEVERLKAVFVSVPELEVTFLEGPVSLPALAAKLAGSPPHILHLVAHGHFDPETGASLYLEAAEGGQVAPVTEEEMVRLVAGCRESLRLVFLASCESARTADGDAFRGLAPKLVRAGVPAVVAMQSEVEVEAAGRFAEAFYSRLLQEGIVDEAANRGRGALLDRDSDRPYAGAPVVFARLREGRLFGRRGVIKGEEASAFWGSLLDAVEEHTCVPILGSGLLEGLLPAPGELARELALDFGYPHPDRDNLPRVAQFGGASDPLRPRRKLLRLLTRAFRRRYGLAAGGDDESGLSAAIRSADWPKLSAARDESEVHRDLAGLNLPLYLTTSFDSFMTEALAARGCTPRRAVLPWAAADDAVEQAVAALDGFTAAEPLVLHLLGCDEDPKSMVVSEDDHLKYLARVARHPRNFLSPVLMDTLTDRMLLFLGYRLDDLDLRILLRGQLAHLNYPVDRPLNLAVQVDPQQDDGPGNSNARQYLEDYSSKYRIRIYWGTARQFVAELHDQWERRRHG